MAVRCGNCQQYHADPSDVRRCCSGEGAEFAYPDREMAERRIARVQEADQAYDWRENGQDSVAAGAREHRKKRPKPVEDGVYEKDGQIFMVVHAAHGSGRPYAKVLDTDADPKKFVYASGAVSHLRAEHRLSDEKAAEYGKLYGTCMFCGISLTREESKSRGYGPTCAGNRGLPYDKSAA